GRLPLPPRRELPGGVERAQAPSSAQGGARTYLRRGDRARTALAREGPGCVCATCAPSRIPVRPRRAAPRARAPDRAGAPRPARGLSEPRHAFAGIEGPRDRVPRVGPCGGEPLRTP